MGTDSIGPDVDGTEAGESKTVERGIWPSGDSKPLAEISLTVDSVARRTGLLFRADEDELDRYLGAYLIDDDVGPMAFMKYENAPAEDVLVYVDSQADVERALSRLATLLDLGNDRLSWRATESRVPLDGTRSGG